MAPMQLDPNVYPRPACHGGPSEMCDGAGLLPFTLPYGREVLVCRLHYYQWKIQETPCDVPGCLLKAQRLYVSTASETQNLCECHYSRLMLLQALDLALLEQAEREASA